MVVLGLFGIALFIVCVIALAAVVTWAVVKLTPSRDAAKSEPAG